MEDQYRFEGERLDSKSALARNNLLEHLARYELVEKNEGGVVLDIGCGTGHGSDTLSKKFGKVHGIDVSEDAIAYAKEHWQSPNVEFRTGDALAIPFPDDTFDAVAAFEVFEHLTDWRKFLSEIRRVLKPGGVAYISTPNKTLYSPGTTKPINPHHVFEMTIPEFKEAVAGYFELRTLYGQRTPVYNDHWIWTIVTPLLTTFRKAIPYKYNNMLKLKLINWIKPELQPSDIVFKDDPVWVERSRFMVAVCGNTK